MVQTWCFHARRSGIVLSRVVTSGIKQTQHHPFLLAWHLWPKSRDLQALGAHGDRKTHWPKWILATHPRKSMHPTSFSLRIQYQVWTQPGATVVISPCGLPQPRFLWEPPSPTLSTWHVPHVIEPDHLGWVARGLSNPNGTLQIMVC